MRVATGIISAGIIVVAIVLLLVTYNQNYVSVDFLLSRHDMGQQSSEHYRDEFREVLGRHLTTEGNGGTITRQIETALKRAAFSEAPSKGRIGWIGSHFKIGTLKGENRLLVKDAQSVYYNSPDKLTIGEPYSEQVVFLKNDKIFYSEELPDVNNLAGFIVVIFTHNNIYYLDLDTSLGKYFVRLDPS